MIDGEYNLRESREHDKPEGIEDGNDRTDSLQINRKPAKKLR